MATTYWLETAGDPRGWAQISREEYETIATAHWECFSMHDSLAIPMVVKAEFPFQLPMGVTMPIARPVQ